MYCYISMFDVIRLNKKPNRQWYGLPLMMLNHTLMGYTLVTENATTYSYHHHLFLVHLLKFYPRYPRAFSRFLYTILDSVMVSWITRVWYTNLVFDGIRYSTSLWEKCSTIEPPSNNVTILSIYRWGQRLTVWYRRSCVCNVTIRRFSQTALGGVIDRPSIADRNLSYVIWFCSLMAYIWLLLSYINFETHFCKSFWHHVNWFGSAFWYAQLLSYFVVLGSFKLIKVKHQSVVGGSCCTNDKVHWHWG